MVELPKMKTTGAKENNFSWVLFSESEMHVHLCLTRSGKIQHFTNSIKIEVLLYLASRMSK